NSLRNRAGWKLRSSDRPNVATQSRTSETSSAIPAGMTADRFVIALSGPRSAWAHSLRRPRQRAPWDLGPTRSVGPWSYEQPRVTPRTPTRALGWGPWGAMVCRHHARHSSVVVNRASSWSPSTLAGMSGRPRLRAYLAFAVAGFRRHSTYRQATVAACVTNSVFGFLRAAVMLA